MWTAGGVRFHVHTATGASDVSPSRRELIDLRVARMYRLDSGRCLYCMFICNAYTDSVLEKYKFRLCAL